MKCIDPWLTKNRRVCPVCKGKVILPGMSDISDSDSEHEAPPPAAPASERTPLLPGTRPARRSHQRRRARTHTRSQRTSSDPGLRARVAGSAAVSPGDQPPSAEPPLRTSGDGNSNTQHLISADITPMVLPSGHMSVNFEDNEELLTDTDHETSPSLASVGRANVLLDMATSIGRQRRQDQDPEV